MALPAPDIVQPVGAPIYNPGPVFGGRTKDPTIERLRKLIEAHRASQGLAVQRMAEDGLAPPPSPVINYPGEPNIYTQHGIHGFGPNGVVSTPDLPVGAPNPAGTGVGAPEPAIQHLPLEPAFAPQLGRASHGMPLMPLHLPGHFYSHLRSAFAARRALGRI